MEPAAPAGAAGAACGAGAAFGAGAAAFAAGKASGDLSLGEGACGQPRQ